MKFIPFNLYDGQNLLPSNEDDEPIDIISALNDFLMSTKGGEILHYNISSTNECNILNRFNTQHSTIVSLSYIATNDSILTLEKDGEIGVVRIYQNWRSNQGYNSPQLLEDGSPLSSSPLVQEFVDQQNNSPHQSHHHHLQVLNNTLITTTIPVPSSVVSISSCPVTSRVIISTESFVSIWTPVYNSYPMLNYFEKILDIHIKNVLQVAVYENYLAYSTLNEVKVLSLTLSFKDPFLDLKKQQQQSQPQNQQQPQPQQPQQQYYDSFKYNNHGNNNYSNKNVIRSVNNGPSEIIEDEHYFEVTFDSNGNLTGKNQLPILEIKSISSSQVPASNSKEEVLGPISDIEHGINVNSESGFTLLASTLLLSKRFYRDDEIHTLFLLPDASSNNSFLLDEPTTTPTTPTIKGTSTNNINVSNSASKLPLTPPRNRSLGQIQSLTSSTSSTSTKLSKSKSSTNISGGASSTIFGGGSKNMVYMRCVISTSREGFVYNISKPSLLSCYLYANETIACTASQSFLYTITTEGLATWTLRSCEGANDGDVPLPCGLGLKNFLYPKKIAVVGDNLLILSKATHDQLFGNNNNNNSNNNNNNNNGGNNNNNNNNINSPIKVPNLLRTPTKTLSPNPKAMKQPEPKQMKQPISDVWSLYIIHHTPLQTLYNEILEYAIKNKEKDDEVYHQLLLEGHFLLQSKLANQHTSSVKMNDMASLLNFGIERKIYQSLLKRSSSCLGDFFYKQTEYMRAALWFSSSDTDIDVVFQLLVSTPESHKSLIYYLEHVLFDPSSYEFLSNNEELCNRILKHYHSHSPHRLPLLILESSISSYSQTLAIGLLTEISSQDDLDLDERNRVYFSLGLLYIDQFNYQETITAFNQIPTESLIHLCLMYPKLLSPNINEKPTDLYKILRKSTPWGLLEITIQLVIQKEITPEYGLDILLSSTSTLSGGILNPISYHHNDYDFDSLLLKIYLEWFLSNNFKQQQQLQLQQKQQQQQQLQMQQQQQNPNNNNNNYSNNNIQQKQQQQNSTMISSTSSTLSTFSQDLVPKFIEYLIHLYVQDIHRFRGSDQQLFNSLDLDIQSIFNSKASSNSNSQSHQKSPQQKIPINNNNNNNSNNNNMNNNQNQAPSSTTSSNFNHHQNIYCNQWILFHLNSFLNIPQWLSKLPPFSTTDINPSAQNEVNYLLTSLYYRKLQSLLSINIVKSFEFMDTIETIFSSNSGSSNNNSNNIVTIARDNAKEKIMLLSLKLACLPLLDRIKESIELVLQSNISIILDYSLHFCKQLEDWSTVLESILSKYQFEKSQTEKELIIHEYEELLSHLSAVLDPDSFLHLLPSNGKIDYYLVFIEKSFSNHQAKILKSNLSSNLLD